MSSYALITGASAGIGAALAREMAAAGHNLILTARREDRLTSLAEELASQVAVEVVASDLASLEGVRKLTDTISESGWQVDILVNNAGMMVEGEFDSLDAEAIQQTITLNITTLSLLTNHFLPAMKKRRAGRILNVASIAAFHPVPGLDLYAATKACVLSLSESLSENLKGSGVSVTALCPGLTATDMVDDSIANLLPPFMMSSPEEVAREGYSALMNREAIRVPGPANQLALTWAKHQPRWLVRGLGGLASRITGSR